MIIAVACQKGGTSKTTTAASIAQALTWKGKRTLLIDTDPQGSASLIYGAKEDGKGGAYSLIAGKEKAETLIQETPAGTIIPASRNLANLDNELSNTPGRDFFLKAGIDPIKEKFDYILIDTAPGLGTCLIQALVAADSVIIPLLCDPQALAGLFQITETINEVKRIPTLNPGLKIAAVVLTQYQARATLTRQYEELIAEQCREKKIPLASTRIRRAIALQEAQATRANLYEYNPDCNPARDYMTLCEELGLIKPERK